MSRRFRHSFAVRVPWFLIALLAAMGRATPACALEPTTPLSRLGRQAWTMENGLPQNTVSVLLQSGDGFLWAGTELGLARFDGASFRIFDHAASPAFPDAEIRCLLDSADGSLWIGTSNGLVRWRGGIAVQLGASDGLPGNGIERLVQTGDGTLWAWTDGGLVLWNGRQFERPPASGWPGGEITSMATGSGGGLWVGTSQGAALLRNRAWHPVAELSHTAALDAALGRPALVKSLPGGDMMIASAAGVYLSRDGQLKELIAQAQLPADGVAFLDRLADGTVAVASKSTLVLASGPEASQHVTRYAVAGQLPGTRIESLYADREDCLWIGTNRGLARIAGMSSGWSVQRMPPTDPLATNAVVSLLEDREGDLWAGTETAGLHILRDARFRILGSSDGLNSDATTAIAQDARKAMWIGTRNNGLNRVVKGEDGSLAISSPATSNGLLSNVILSLAAAPNGDVWAGTPDGLNRIARGVVSSFTSADGLPDDFIRSVLAAPDNSIWIGTRRGLTHFDHGRFVTYTQADGLGSDLIGALSRTLDGDLWIATLNGLARLRQGKIRNYTTADGLSSNVITALQAAPDGSLWIGTQNNGLNLWDGRQFLAANRGATAKSSPLPSAIHAILLDDRDHLWLATGGGLTRVDLPAIHACLSQQACDANSVHAISFSTADGLRSRETSSNSHPTASRAADGTLWFTTPRGVIVADPLHFPANPPAPPVAIERFAVDDRDLPLGDSTRITAGALRFQFDYSGLSLASPQKLRYRYMLEGFDHGWTDAGARRTAYYTNIPAGTYTFRVRAALSDADFTAIESAAHDKGSAPQEASLAFVLQPHFYETWWFSTLAALAVLALVLLIFRRRVLRVEREFRAVMGERNRIAREIHDTLAQGYVGISLQLEILGELLRHNRPEAAQKHLALTQGMVREGLDDARQSIWALRSQDAGEQTLPIRLRRLVEKSGDANLAANFEVYGAYRPLRSEAEREILRIAQEAIQNVKKHAAARRLAVRLAYDAHLLTLTVNDNGKGFAAQETDKAGHYGLTGMRERAALIGATLEVDSQPGAGTVVNLCVPAPEAQ